ncbi:hypothetical protein MMC08_004222 [Hypocenomyce scalaris]|nr:hypothetical protein [Hypocenomyce scalaris]
MRSSGVVCVGSLLLSLCSVVPAFPFLADQALSGSISKVKAKAKAKRQIPIPETTWSPSQLVDVTGDNAWAAPTAGQARGPCPGQNALANHGYIDRSGFTSLVECISANVEVFNLSYEFAAVLCFMAQFTGGNLLGLTWTIGNDSSVQSSITEACPAILPLGVLDPLVDDIVCGYLNPVTDHVLGTPGSGLAQTVNSFEGPHSMFQWDWGTENGEDASTVDMTAFQAFWDDALRMSTEMDRIFKDCSPFHS